MNEQEGSGTAQPEDTGRPDGAGQVDSAERDRAGGDGDAITALAARIAELEEQRLRALADLDNERKRCAVQVRRAEAETRATVARQWLPVVDNLDQSEVERMIADAEQHRDEDRRLRELTDARNELDTAAYQVEHLLAERGDSVPVHQKARAENLAADARQALKEDTPLDRIRSLTAELRQVYQELLSAGSPPPAGQAGPAPGGGGDGGSGGDDDVIDAEFTPSE